MWWDVLWLGVAWTETEHILIFCQCGLPCVMRELEMVLQCVLGCNIVSLLIPIRAGWLVYFGQEVPGSSLLHYIWSWSVYDRQTGKQSSVFVTVMELAVALHSICAWQMDKQSSVCVTVMLLVLQMPVGLSSHVWCQNTEYFHCENSKDSLPVCFQCPFSCVCLEEITGRCAC